MPERKDAFFQGLPRRLPFQCVRGWPEPKGRDHIRLMVYNIGMTKVSTAAARKRFSDVVNRASYAKERVALTRYGHTMAAIVPAEDLDLLEAMEDRIDAQDARKALAEMKAKGDKPIPWAKVKKRLGL